MKNSLSGTYWLSCFRPVSPCCGKLFRRGAVLIMLVFFLLPAAGASGPKPVVYTIGDSTVKNGRGDGAGGQWGWGDLLVHFFDTSRITFRNHALGGTSSRTFITRGLWAEVAGRLKPGDYLLMQFGHNDGGPVNDTLRARGTLRGTGGDSVEIHNLITGKEEVVRSYGWYLRKMVREAKARGARPVMVTPVPRNDWKEGRVVRTPGSYRDWTLEIARQEKVPCIDLNHLMAAAMDSLGEQGVTGRYFEARDHTHTTGEGARLAASLIARRTASLKKCRLKKYLQPDPPEELFRRYLKP